MLDSGLVSITFRSLSPEDIIRHVARNELSAIEWGGDVHVPHGNTDTARRVAKQTADAGLAVAAYGSYYQFQDIFDDTGPDWSSVLETADALGAPTLRVWAGRTASAQADSHTREAIVEKSRLMASQAEARNISIAFEYHSNTLTDTNESARQLLEDINHPNVQTLWQPTNGATHQYCVAGLRAITHRLSNIHCFYWGPSGGSDKRPLAQGAGRWTEYLSIAADATPTEMKRYVLMEFVADGTVEMFDQDAVVLRKWLEEANGNRGGAYMPPPTYPI